MLFVLVVWCQICRRQNRCMYENTLPNMSMGCAPVVLALCFHQIIRNWLLASKRYFFRCAGSTLNLEPGVVWKAIPLRNVGFSMAVMTEKEGWVTFVRWMWMYKGKTTGRRHASHPSITPYRGVLWCIKGLFGGWVVVLMECVLVRLNMLGLCAKERGTECEERQLSGHGFRSCQVDWRLRYFVWKESQFKGNIKCWTDCVPDNLVNLMLKHTYIMESWTNDKTRKS